jgi:hypothetical protein
MKPHRLAGSFALATIALCLTTSQALAAPASISPSTLAAGKTTQVTVKAPACNSYDILLEGSILAGPADLVDSGRKAAKAATHAFKGQVVVKASAGKGGHTLSIRCGGGLYGSVHIGIGASGAGGSSGSGSGLGTVTLQIGKTYATTAGAADGDPVGGQLTIHWGACLGDKGKSVTFPDDSMIYNADGVGWPVGAEFAVKSGAFKDPHGIYVSPLLKPGTVKENLACHSEFGNTYRHGKLTIKLVRQVVSDYRSGLSPTGAFLQLAPGLNGIGSNGLGDPELVSVPACRDGNALLTMSSQGLVPNTLTVQNHHIGVTDFEGWETRFEWLSLTAVSTPGNYPITLSCGSGTVATGTLRVAES